MDPWPQKIFLAADGQRSIREYIYDVAGEYRGKVPGQLDETILHEIETLIKEKIIELQEVKQRPEPSNDQAKVFPAST